MKTKCCKRQKLLLACSPPMFICFLFVLRPSADFKNEDNSAAFFSSFSLYILLFHHVELVFCFFFVTVFPQLNKQICLELWQSYSSHLLYMGDGYIYTITFLFYISRQLYLKKKSLASLFKKRISCID